MTITELEALCREYGGVAVPSNLVLQLIEERRLLARLASNKRIPAMERFDAEFLRDRVLQEIAECKS